MNYKRHAKNFACLNLFPKSSNYKIQALKAIFQINLFFITLFTESCNISHKPES